MQGSLENVVGCMFRKKKWDYYLTRQPSLGIFFSFGSVVLFLFLSFSEMSLLFLFFLCPLRVQSILLSLLFSYLFSIFFFLRLVNCGIQPAPPSTSISFSSCKTKTLCPLNHNSPFLLPPSSGNIPFPFNLYKLIFFILTFHKTSY